MKQSAMHIAVKDTYVRVNDAVPENGRDFSLKELQSFVGGSIQMITLSDKRLMIMHEEGKIIGLEPNQFATALAEDVLMPDDFICGDVLVCTKNFIR